MNKFLMSACVFALVVGSVFAQAAKPAAPAASSMAETGVVSPVVMVDGKAMTGDITVMPSTMVKIVAADGVNVHVVDSKFTPVSAKASAADVSKLLAKLESEIMDASMADAAKAAGTKGIVAKAKYGSLNVAEFHKAAKGAKWTLTMVSEKDKVISNPVTITLIKG